MPQCSVLGCRGCPFCSNVVSAFQNEPVWISHCLNFIFHHNNERERGERIFLSKLEPQCVWEIRWCGVIYEWMECFVVNRLSSYCFNYCVKATKWYYRTWTAVYQLGGEEIQERKFHFDLEELEHEGTMTPFLFIFFQWLFMLPISDFYVCKREDWEMCIWIKRSQGIWYFHSENCT